MKDFKEYNNLFELYRRNQNKWLTALAIFIVLLILSFAAAVADVFFDTAMVLMVISLFCSIAVAITSLVIRIRTVRSLSRFTDGELSRIDSQITSMQKMDNIGVISDAVVYCSRGALILYAVKDILWVYREVTTTRMYGIIPISKLSSVCIIDKNRKRHTFPTRNKNDAVVFLQKELQKYRKGIFYGYSQELNTMFYHDFNRMLSLSEDYEMQAR